MKEKPIISNFTSELLNKLEVLKQDIPESIKYFSELSKQALEEGILNKKTKSLIALSVSISNHSNDCITYHIHNLISQGFTYNELLELTSIAIYMGGGPALMSAQYAIDVYQKFEAESKSTPD